MANAQHALDVLGDPTRRRIIERLASGPLPVGGIAKGLPVSRPAVSQHLKLLKQAGLVTDCADGTRRIYRIDPHGLGALRTWLGKVRDNGQVIVKWKVGDDGKRVATRKRPGERLAP